MNKNHLNLDSQRAQIFHDEHNPSLSPKRPSFSPSASMRIAGEIIEVKDGRIIRSTSRKDRHSKVCTAKGTRDRRVRLSAHTAIKFYDVQDRLGYDRPSKAVDWLMKNAKSAIDDLTRSSESQRMKLFQGTGESVFTSSFIPPPLDTIKSFFPAAPQNLLSQNPADSGHWPVEGGYEMGHGQLFSQRGTLQSSNFSSVCPWMDPVELQIHRPASSIGFPGFQIPTRIHDDENHDGGQ